MDKYQICEFIDGNGKTWYQIKIIRPIFFGLISMRYYLANYYYTDGGFRSYMKYDTKYDTKNDAEDAVGDLIRQDKSYDIKLIHCGDSSRQ